MQGVVFHKFYFLYVDNGGQGKKQGKGLWCYCFLIFWDSLCLFSPFMPLRTVLLGSSRYIFMTPDKETLILNLLHPLNKEAKVIYCCSLCTKCLMLWLKTEKVFDVMVRQMQWLKTEKNKKKTTTMQLGCQNFSGTFFKD